MRRISFLAILVGGTVSYVVPAILAMPLAFLFSIRLVAARHSPAALQHEIIVGGYLAGVTARHDEVLNGLLSSIISVLITTLFHTLDPHPFFIRLLKVVGIIVACGIYVSLLRYAIPKPHSRQALDNALDTRLSIYR